ncbi:MAG: carotenoid biosynthesis protein [Halorhabdus sp.]
MALAHAALTWPAGAVLALFAGGALIAFLAEAIVVHHCWLDHHLGPAVWGVALYVLFGWTAVVYVAFRIALLVTEGWIAVFVGATIATGFDSLTDHYGVEAGYWTYTDDLPGPRYRAVPWWNYAGWFVVSSLSGALAGLFL